MYYHDVQDDAENSFIEKRREKSDAMSWCVGWEIEWSVLTMIGREYQYIQDGMNGPTSTLSIRRRKNSIT